MALDNTKNMNNVFKQIQNIYCYYLIFKKNTRYERNGRIFIIFKSFALKQFTYFLLA